MSVYLIADLHLCPERPELTAKFYEFLEVYDYDQNVQAVALGIIQQYIRDHELQNLDTQRIEQEVLKGVREASAGWGLYIEKVYITDIGRTQNVRLLMNEPIFKEIE